MPAARSALLACLALLAAIPEDSSLRTAGGAPPCSRLMRLRGGEAARPGASTGDLGDCRGVASLEEGLRKRLEREPADVDALYLLALLHSHSSLDFRSAEDLYQRVLDLDPCHVGALCNYGSLKYVAMNDYAGAEALLQRALAEDPASLSARVQLDVVRTLRVASGEAPSAPLSSALRQPLGMEAGAPHALPGAGAAEHGPHTASPGSEPQAVRDREGDELMWGGTPAPRTPVHRPTAPRAQTPREDAATSSAAAPARFPRSPVMTDDGAQHPPSGERTPDMEDPPSFRKPSHPPPPAPGRAPQEAPERLPEGGGEAPGEDGLDSAVKMFKEPTEPAEAPEECPASVPEMLSDRRWNVRAYGYETLAHALASGKGDCGVGDVAAAVCHALGDANIPAQEKAMDLAAALLSCAQGDSSAVLAEQAVEVVVNKGLGNARNGKKAQSLLLIMLSKGGTRAAACIIPALLAGFTAKVAKKAALCVEGVRLALELFGSDVADPEQLLPASVAIFESSLAPVRAEALPLAVQIYKSYGALVRKNYEGLRPVQLKDFEAAVADLPTVPTRPKSKLAAGEGEGGGGGGAYMPSVDLVALLPKDFCSRILKEPKWQDKKEMLDDLVSKGSGAQIKGGGQGDYFELVRCLKILMADYMALVVASAIKAIGVLAAGLGPDFRDFGRSLCPALLDKLKDKNRGVVEATHATLDCLIENSFSLEDVADSLAFALGKSSTPKVRIESIKFIARAAPHHSESVAADASHTAKAGAAQLCGAVAACLNDGAIEVREAAMSAVAALVAVHGRDAAIGGIKLDPKRLKKLNAMLDGAGARFR